MKCLLCNNEKFICIHNGTRDVPNLKVMKCTECGLVQLDSNEYNTEQNYEEGGMLQNTYSVTENKTDNLSWETWIRETAGDDDRRYEALKEVCKGKRVLEFGCGNGGFLRRIKDVAADVAGIELMDEARRQLKKEGITVYRTLDEINEKYDVVCMFMVIEHLNNPDEVLEELRKRLKKEGLFVCETVNEKEALISQYGCNEFANFTYWSEHVLLFNSDTLEKLLSRNGFETVLNTQLQRYPLCNHLYWLSQGKPGGHMRWANLDEKELNDAYEKKLVSMGIADTLWYVGRKNSEL